MSSDKNSAEKHSSEAGGGIKILHFNTTKHIISIPKFIQKHQNMKRGPKKTINGIVLGESGVSTRRLILEKASEIINVKGMNDFRIDTLAASLGMSSGNVTYHFSRKEEIAVSVWLSCLQEITSSLDHYISPLMDIKQLFLFYKYLVTAIYKNRGVFRHRLSDVGLIRSNRESIVEAVKTFEHTYDKKISTLIINGYIEPERYEKLRMHLFENMATITGWWVDNLFATFGRDPEEDSSKISDRYALTMLMTIEPVLTDKGRKQLDSVYSLIK